MYKGLKTRKNSVLQNDAFPGRTRLPHYTGRLNQKKKKVRQERKRVLPLYGLSLVLVAPAHSGKTPSPFLVPLAPVLPFRLSREAFFLLCPAPLSLPTNLLCALRGPEMGVGVVCEFCCEGGSVGVGRRGWQGRVCGGPRVWWW
jgi:hypothetical protein